MRRRGLVLGAGVVAGVMLLASAAGAGSGQVEVVVASGGTSGCTGFVIESLSGVVSGCIPVAGSAGVATPVAAASDDSVVFGSPAPHPPCPDPGGCAYIPETGTLTELVHANGSAVTLDAVAWDEYDGNPTISADGSRVTFLRDVENASQIYVVNADGSGLRLLAATDSVPGDGSFLGAPAISPDGNSIAYWCVSAASTRKCGPLPDGSYRQSGLMLMNAEGSDRRMIVIGATASYPAPDSLSWSPNGQWLTMDGLGEGCGSGPASLCTRQVFAYRTNGRDLFNYRAHSRQVTHEKKGTGPGPPQFCGSSNQILYESGSYPWGPDGDAVGLHAYLVNRNGTHRQRTTFDSPQTGYPACVPPVGGRGPSSTVNVMRVTVPRVRTLSYAAAKRRLHRAHLHVGTVKRAFSARVRRGHVIAQYPHAGAHAHRSTKQGPPVKLVLSRGPRN